MGLNVGNIILIWAGRSVQVTYALFMVGIIFLRRLSRWQEFYRQVKNIIPPQDDILTHRT